MNALVKTEEKSTRPAPAMMAGGRVQAIVPQSMDECYRLAKAVVMAGMAPRGMDTPEACTVAILHGLEVGLTPMAALQRIAVVNGRPTIWGDGAIGLVRASGLCEYVRERLDGNGDKMVAVCEVKRKGEPEAVTRSFSIDDAKRAGLWNKQGPWQQYPTRMLAMRARAFALRDVFADVLGGLYLREEIEDTREMRDVTPPSPPPAPPAAALNAPKAPPPPPSTEEVRERIANHPLAPNERVTEDGEIAEERPEGSPDAQWFDALEAALAKAKDDPAEVEQVWSDLDVRAICAHEDDWGVAVAIRRRFQPEWLPEQDEG